MTGPIFDWWIVPHVAFFIFLASSVHAAWEPQWWVHVLLCCLVAFGWELAEHFLSRRFIETWIVVEHPVNSWVVDPISDAVGYVIGVLVGRWSKNRAKT